MTNNTKLIIGLLLLIVGSGFTILSAFQLEIGSYGWAAVLAVSIITVIYGLILVEHVRSEEGW